ncbi:MAG TPA: NAD-dependent epimerase/dehydratase family protein [Candidatus Acidoferrales bacterium]|nr:NAD-dependent epimerase/dehydratase family protein [Candidatus Acidoferrales bacterium]
MKILVTGGAGFIASHIVDAYIDRGHEVHVIDDFSTGNKRNVNPKATVHTLDIADRKTAALIGKIKPDALNHHAAQMDLRRSVEDPMLDARINIMGFVNLLEASKNAGVKRVLFASSGGAVYGDKEPIPADEEHPTEPMSPYGVSKKTGELYLAYYHAAFGMPYIALRYSNVYGPRQSSKGEAGVVAIFISQLLAGKSPLINGDGKQTRDYVFVGDVVKANIAALESNYTGPLNIGTGKETDVLTICSLLRQGLNSDMNAVHGPAKTGEQRRSCLDTSRARRVLGWSAEVSLPMGLERTFSYWRETSAP